MRRSQFRCGVAAATFLFVFVHTAAATMIVVIYTKDGFWLAADSYREAGGKHVANVCKIHETRFGLLAKSGSSQGTTESGEIYSTDKEVEDSIASSENLEAFQAKLRIRFKQDIDKELAFLVDNPKVTSLNVENYPMGAPIPSSLISTLLRTVVTFDTKASDVSGKVLIVAPQSVEMMDSFKRKYYKYWAPSLLGWHDANDVHSQTIPPDPPINYPSSIHEFSYLVSYSQPDVWVQKHPQQAIKELFEKAHHERPESIGPPYTILRVITRTKFPKIQWVSKGVCPGWTESIDEEHSLVRLRDEMRKQKSGNQ